MSTLTLGIIVIIYMFVIAWLGYLGYRQTKNTSDYLLGGRKVNPIIMALSYGATFISASAIVGFGGVGRYDQGEDQQGQMKVDVKHLFDEDGSSLHHHGGVEGHADENDRGDEDLYRPGLIV